MPRDTFAFEADDRTFRCTIEPVHSGNGGSWWWFSVTGEAHRYAPFQADEGDTQQRVAARVVRWYRALLVRRSLPLDRRTTLKLRRARQAARER
jgi:hypothetical protein